MPMASSPSPFPDPLQLWREALTRLEGDANTLATGSLQSQEVLRALHQLSGASLGMQQFFERLLDGYLRRANLPSRKEIEALAETLRRIEDKLDRMLPPQPAADVRRPARTRRPASATAASPAAPDPAAADEPAPAKKHAAAGKRPAPGKGRSA